MPRRLAYALLGAGLAQAVLLGLCAVRVATVGRGSLSALTAEAARERWTYLYVAVATTAVFAGFGYALGRQADRLYELSATDPLTGLRNRRVLYERLVDELARGERYPAPLSLLLVDLDGLKALNDQLGHRAGDAALRRVAFAIRSGSRATDIAARWGGDEFALLAPHTGSEEAGSLAERIRLAALGEAGTRRHAVTVSIGVATLEPQRGPELPEALVRAADDALYRAKAAGRNRVEVA